MYVAVIAPRDEPFALRTLRSVRLVTRSDDGYVVRS